ncbi:MAG: SulP family inorganic anion transporter [Leptolyngbya sp. BL-A-14]
MLSSLKQEFKQELKTQGLFPIVTAGLVVGISVTLMGIIPMAALVFPGKLERFLSTGITLTLISSVIISMVLALRSSLVGVVAFVLAEEATILGAMGTAIAQTMPADATDSDILITIVAAIGLSSLLTGIFMFLLGQFQLGELIRFLPYPVVGGFLAGLGYLITDASFLVLTNGKASLINLPTLFQGEMLLRWFPALVLAVLLLVIGRRPAHYLALPGTVVGAIGLFYLMLFLTQTSLSQAFQGGWLLGPFPEGSEWNLSNLSSLPRANWSIVFSQLGEIAALILITALSLLVVSSALEIITQQDIDLNRELRLTGIGCFLSGLFGGVVASHAVIMLSEKMGVRSRLAGVISALVYGVFLLVGVSLLTFFPRPVLGGVLLFTGLDLLALQLYDGWFRLPKLDYAIVLGITAIVVLGGFLMGVAVGLVVMIILFVFNYSQINVARYVFSGASFGSHRKRPLNQERLLQEQGEQTYVMTLQGFIFFGTANRLVKQIRQRLSAPDLATLRFVILDFRWVTGLDSSAVVSFVKLKQLADKHQFQILLADLAPALEKLLRQSRVLAPDDPICHQFPDLDRSLEWCENQVLGASKYRRTRSLPFSLLLKTILTADNDQIAILMTYLKAFPLEAKQCLFNSGDAPDRLYFIESGEMSTIMVLMGGKTQRIQTLGAGTTIGEVEFYTQTPYALSAIAEQSSKLYYLDLQSLQAMQKEHPQIATIFGEFMTRLLANRLASVQKEITKLTAH